MFVLYFFVDLLIVLFIIKSVILNSLYQFTRLTVTSTVNQGGLKTHSYGVTKSKTKVSSRPWSLSRSSRGRIFLAYSHFLVFPAILGVLWLADTLLQSLSPSSHHILPVFSLLIRTQVIVLGPIIIQYDLILNYICKNLISK